MQRTWGVLVSLKNVIWLFGLLGLVGCLTAGGGGGGGGGGSNSDPITSVALSPTTATLDIGFTQQFTVTATTKSGKKQTGVSASWSSSHTTVATVTPTGLTTAVAAGTTTITATVTTPSGNVSGTATLNVKPATLVSIDVTPANPSIGSGDTQQFTATGTYNDGSHKLIAATWTSSDTNVATINNSGLATAVGGGTTTITASSGGISGSTTLTVTAVTLVSIAVTPTDPSIGIGETKQFKATGTYSDGSQQVIASPDWSSSDASVATININGLATAVGTGTTTITASSNGIDGSTTLTVTASHTYVGTQSPGDLWSVAVDDAALTFTAVNSSSSLNYAGSLTALPNGFYKTTLTASTDPSLPIGTTGYALEVPAVALAISLGGATDKPIAAIEPSPCAAPSSTLTASLIDLGNSTYDSSQSESYAKMNGVKGGANTYQFNVQSYLLDGTLRGVSGPLPSGTCLDSAITIPNVPRDNGGTSTFTVFSASNGLYVLDMGRNSLTNAGEGGALGTITPINSTQVSNALSQTYLGMLFRLNSTPITTFVGFGPGSGTSITGGTYVNLDTDPFNSHGTSITIDLPSSPGSGFLQGTLTDPNGTHTPFVAAITKSGGKYFLFGITTDTSTTTPYVVVLAQQ